MSKLLKKLQKAANNKYGFIADEEDNIYKIKEYHDTGCYILNAAISGDMFGGIVDGKRYMVAGESSTAKSYFTSFMLKGYMDKFPKSIAVIFETEGSTVLEMIDSINIDPARILILPVKTIEDCRNQCMKLLSEIQETNNKIKSSNEEATKKIEDLTNKLNKILKKKKPTDNEKKKLEDHKKEISKCQTKIKDPEKFIFLIDSLGQLSTSKEVSDIEEGKETKDMTRPGLLKGFGRVSSLEFSVAQVPLLVVNHTYKSMDKYSGDIVGGGGGPMYMADVCLMLSKGQAKDESNNRIGANIGVKIYKSRFGKEGIMSHIIIHFAKGLYKYSDLVIKAAEYGVFKKEGNSYVLPDGTTATMKVVRTNFKQYATDINMNAIAKAIKENFKFGQIESSDEEINIEEVESIDTKEIESSE